MALNFARIILTYRIEKNIPDLYFLFTIKNQFHTACRETTGCFRQSCSGCKESNSCFYNMLHSQALSADPLAVKRYQKPGLPFVFQFPLLPPMPNLGKNVEIPLNLLGSAMYHVGHVIDAAAAALRGVMTLVSAESVDHAGNRYLLRDMNGQDFHDRLYLHSAADFCAGAPMSQSVTIDIQTPLRLLHHGVSVTQLSFSIFIRALFRRVSSLVYYYGGEEMRLDFKQLAGLSEDVSTVRSSTWTEWRPSGGGKIGGMIGKAEFSGSLLDFLPFLLLGQHLNLGKGASFGLGRYVVEQEAEN